MKVSILFGLLIASSLINAQENNRKSNSSISINFSSVPLMSTSAGDTSFENAFSITPIIDLRTKTGWGISYAPSIVTSGLHPGIYMHTVSAGYERYGEKNFDLAFNYNHFFFSKNEQVPYSPLNNEIYFYLNYTQYLLQPVLASSIGFGTDTSGGTSSSVHDIDLVLGLNHHFNWEDKGIFSSIELTPSLLANIGTNGYFSFLNNSKYLSHSNQFINYVKNGNGNRGRGRGRGGNNNTSTIPTASNFSLSNIEAALEGDFIMGSFTLRPNGSLFFPTGSNSNGIFGYCQLTVQYHF